MHIWFGLEIHADQCSTGADPRATDAILPAVVLIKGRCGSQVAGEAVLPVSQRITPITKSDYAESQLPMSVMVALDPSGMEAIMTIKNRHTIKQLQAWAKAEKNKPLAAHIQTIVLATQGWSSEHIVQMTGYCRRTIHRWVARYNQAGLTGLVDQPRSGRPS